MTGLLVGTEDGAFLLSEDETGWATRASYLKGCEVTGIAVAAAGETAFAATRSDGLFRIDLARESAEQVGAGVLPNVQRCVAVSPHDPNVVLVGTEPAALYRSDDGGNSWTECRAVAELVARREWLYPVPTIPPHIRHILVDWNDADVIYAAGQVGGVLKSEDGGTTWRDFTEEIDPDVHMIVQDPRDPQVIYAICGGGGDIVHGYPPPAPQGHPIYRSRDGGESWQCISADFERNYGVQMVVDPEHPERLMAPVARDIPSRWTARPEKADVVVVCSDDGGATWSAVSGGLPARFPVMIEAVAMADRTVFLATGGQVSKRFPDEPMGEIYGSADFGKGWQKLPAQLPSVFCMTAA